MPSRRAAERALEQLPVILEEAAVIRGQAVSILDKASRLGTVTVTASGVTRPDPGLTPVGIAQRQAEMGAQARSLADPLLEALNTRWDDAAATIRGYADGFRPELPDDARGLASISITWEGVRRRIESGRRLDRLIRETSSTDVLLALREWGSDFLRAIGEEAETFDASPLEHAVDRRLAELGDGLWLEALQWVDQLEGQERIWQIWRAHDFRLVRGIQANTVEAGMRAKTAVLMESNQQAFRDDVLEQLAARVQQRVDRSPTNLTTKG